MNYRIRQFALLLLPACVFILLYGCDSRVFDNPLDPEFDHGAGAILRSFPAPGGNPWGISFHAGLLWCTDASEGKIYRLNPDTGSIYNAMAAPGPRPRGIVWAENYLWCVDAGRLTIYRLDPNNGHVDFSFRFPGVTPAGLEWDGSSLWAVDETGGAALKIQPSSGNILGKYTTPDSVPSGIAGDGLTFRIAGAASRAVFRTDFSTSQREFTAPGPAPAGLAMNDSDSLWICDQTGMIYLVALSESQTRTAPKNPHRLLFQPLRTR